MHLIILLLHLIRNNILSIQMLKKKFLDISKNTLIFLILYIRYIFIYSWWLLIFFYILLDWQKIWRTSFIYTIKSHWGDESCSEGIYPEWEGTTFNIIFPSILNSIFYIYFFSHKGYWRYKWKIWVKNAMLILPILLVIYWIFEIHPLKWILPTMIDLIDVNPWWG